jgi:hypothetical protein
VKKEPPNHVALVNGEPARRLWRRPVKQGAEYVLNVLVWRQRRKPDTTDFR